MNLLQMSFYATIIILITIIIRTLAINRLPKKTFIILWEIALIRLLIPFTFPSSYSIYSIIDQRTQIIDTSIEKAVPIDNIQTTIIQPAISNNIQNPEINISTIIWFVGMIICTIFFVITYIRCYKKFKTAKPINNEYITNWLKSHKLNRKISVKQSNTTFVPLTYGIFKPVILLPQNIQNTNRLQYILTHEYIHIKHFDVLKKMILTVALCLHWFNPLVWVMYILANQDLELSCDETVIHLLGEDIKSDYALALISMEEQKNSIIPFTNNFNRNAVEERIKSIMKTKKITIASLFITIILIVGTVTIFGTSPTKETNSDEPVKEVYSIEPTKKTISQENTSKSLATNTSTETTSQEDGKERLFKKYEPVGLIYDTESHFLYFNNKPVRYFRDYYQLYAGDDQTEHNFGELSFFNEIGTIDVYAVRKPWTKSSEIIRNPDGSFDPGGQIVGIEICSEEEFNSRNIDEIKKDESCYTPEKPYRGNIVNDFVSESKATAIKSLDPIAIAKETYSIYEPFKLVYSEEQDCLFYNNQKVRYFFDMLASNGETFSSGNFKGALRGLTSNDGVVDIYAIRDFSKLDKDGYGELVEIKIYDEGDFNTRTGYDLENKCFLDNQNFNLNNNQ